MMECMRQLGHHETLKKMPLINIECVLYLFDVSCENLGLILRSADIFGVSAVYYKTNNNINNKQLQKLSRNSRVPLYLTDNAEPLFELKNNGYEIIALEITDASIPLSTVSFRHKTCLIIGNEQYGVPENILNIVDYACHIEMVGGHISSLNVSVATSIVLYEIIKCYL